MIATCQRQGFRINRGSLCLLACGVLVSSVVFAADEPELPPGGTAILKGHTASLFGVAFSPDGKTVATASFDKSVKLWDVANGKQIKSFEGPSGHQSLVLCVAFSPDGQLLASGGQDNTAKIWEVPMGTYLQELGHSDAVNALALSPDGLKLAGAGKDGTIKIWTPADGKQILNLTGHAGPVTGVAFNAVAAPAGQVLASCGSDRTVRLWNPTDGQSLGTVLAHAGPVTGVVIHPNNNAAYSAGEDGTLKFWQLPIALPRPLPPHAEGVTALALSPDGSQVVSASADKTIRVSSFGDGKPIRQLTGPGAGVRSVAVGQNLIAAGTADSRLWIWNASDGKPVSQTVAHGGAVTGVAFHPQNNQLVTAGGDGLIKTWAMPPVPGRALPHPAEVVASALTGDGKRLITGGSDRIVRSWNLANNSVERQYQGHTAAITTVAITANGQVLASGSADQTIRLWDQNNGKEKGQVGAHAGLVTALAINQGGTQMLSAAADGTVKLWGVPGAPPRIFTHMDQVTSAALSADGTKLLTGCTDKQVRLWNLTNGNMERAFAGNTLAVTAVAVSANGALVAAGGADKTVTVWNAADGKEVKKFTLPAAVLSVAFLPGGPAPTPLVAAGLADNSVHLLDTAQGKDAKTLGGHKGAVFALAFLPKGDQLISGSADGTVQVWSVADGMPKTKLELGAPVNGIALTGDGARLAAGGAGKTIKTWTLADGKPGMTIDTPAEVKGLSWNADGSRLVVACADNQARVYNNDGKLAEFFPHEGPVTSAVFHPDGKRIISASADKTARVWGLNLLWQAAHAGPVRQALYTLRGDQILSASDDKTIKVWNAADGKLIKSIIAHDGTVIGLGLSADGGKMVSAGGDNKVKVWNLTPPKPGAAAEDKPAAIFALTGAPYSVAISPNGTRVAAGVTDKTASSIVVFDVPAGKEVVSLADHTGIIRSLAFQGDNRTLVSTSDDKTARLSDVGVLNVLDGHAAGVTAVAFHGNGTQFISSGMDKTVKLWAITAGKEPAVQKTFGPLQDPVSAVVFSRDFSQIGAGAGKIVKVWTVDGKEVLTLVHPADVKGLSFSVDKTKLVTGAADGLARIWDLATGKELQAFSHAGPVDSVVFHNNNTAIVSGSADKTVVVHSLSAVRVIPVATVPIRSLAITPNGSHVLTADDKEVKLWNTANGAREARVFAGGEGGVTAVAVSKNNNLVALGGPDLTVRLYNFADAKAVGQFKTKGIVHHLAFSSNNQTLAAACADRSLLTWNVVFNPGQPLAADFGKPGPPFTHDAAATDAVFDIDGTRLYSAGLDKKIRKWKFSSDLPAKNFGHPQLVDAVAFNPAGTQLATGCHDGTVRTWDVAKGQQLKQINAHTTPMPAAVYCVAWSPDGKQLVSSSYDHSLKLWDAAAGTLVREFKAYKEKDFEKGHHDGVFAVAFSPDGKFLVSGSSDRSIKIWNTADGSVVRDLINPNFKAPPTNPLPQIPQAHPGQVYSLQVSPDGKYIVSGGNAPRNHGYLAVWGFADGKLIYGEELATGPICALAISPDGKQLGLACGPRGAQFQEASGFLMKMPDGAK
jgi:WD40 repeat protein